jgi:hypothetical protein
MTDEERRWWYERGWLEATVAAADDLERGHPPDELAAPAPPRRPPAYLRYRHGIRAWDGELNGHLVSMFTSGVIERGTGCH